MRKVCIAGFHNLHLMQFLYKYTDILDANEIEYDVLYWDRDMDDSISYKPFGGKGIAFKYKMSNYQPKYKKILGFVRCILFFKKMILRNKYDRVILLTTQTALPLYLFSKKIFRKEQYIYDYRDITYEKIPFCKSIIKKIIDGSAFTAISSHGFKEVLGNSEKFLISHNVSNLEYNKIVSIPYENLRIVYWGIVRQIEFNKKICDIFGNIKGVELIYHGEGDANILNKYCQEKGYTQVKFTGRYTVSEIESFAKNTDVLFNLYENDETQKLATTVKLYDGIRYGLPMLISKGSHMAQLMKDNPYALVLDPDTVEAEDVVSWYAGLDKDKYPYDKELSEIRKDDETFRDKLLSFVRK